MGTKSKNTIDVVLNRAVFDRIKGDMSIKDFYEVLITKFDIGLSYKSFINLMTNRVTWRLLHAYAIAKTLGVPIDEFLSRFTSTRKSASVKGKWNVKVSLEERKFNSSLFLNQRAVFES